MSNQLSSALTTSATTTIAQNDRTSLGLDEAFLRRLERLRVAVRKNRAGMGVGARRSPSRGSSVEFADFRQYMPGDDLRRLDWNAYARLGRLFMRLYHDEQNATVHLLLDVSASMDSGADGANKLRWSKQLAGALGYIALAELDRVTVSAVAGSIVGRTQTYSGVRTTLRMFDDIAAIPVAAEATDLDRALGAFKSRPPGPAILVSDLLVHGWGREGIHALQVAGNDVAVVHVLSPEEEDPDLRGDVRLVDRETRESREVTVDAALLDRYRASLAAWKWEINDACHARGIPYLPIRSDSPHDEFVFGAMRRERVVS